MFRTTAQQTSKKFRARVHIAAVAALLLGMQSIIAATGVLSGLVQPSYFVLRWIVIYNGIVGLAAVAIAAGTWLGRNVTRAPRYVFAAHGLVLFGLVTMYLTGAQVATQSIAAMIFRSVAWAGIALIIPPLSAPYEQLPDVPKPKENNNGNH